MVIILRLFGRSIIGRKLICKKSAILQIIIHLRVGREVKAFKQACAQLRELGRAAVSRIGHGNGNDFCNAPGARRHHYDSVAEVHRLVYIVGD